MATNFPKYILVHHTGGTNNDPMADTSHHTVDTVRDWHVNGRGWDDIGYHWFIEKDGAVRQGRAEHLSGAHAIGYNSNSIGICLAGNFDATLPTKAQENALREKLKVLVDRYNISHKNIIPHRAVATKTCYGIKLSESWARDLLKPQVSTTQFAALVMLLRRLFNK